MGKADYYSDGDWNFYCDLCGCKNKTSDSMLTWNNLRVCRHHKEVRNPQDYVRGVRDDQSVPWTRSKGIEQVVQSNFKLLQENGDGILLEDLSGNLLH